MFKLRVKPLLACLSIVAVPLLASTAQANTRDIHLSCDNGNFEGEVILTYGSIGYLTANTYKIKKSNGQQGGNKANINIKILDVASGHQIAEFKSPDSMLQNNTWQSLPMKGSVPRDRPLVLLAEFIFDKSGSDPKCEARASLNTSWDRDNSTPVTTKPGAPTVPATSTAPTGALTGSLIRPPQ